MEPKSPKALRIAYLFVAYPTLHKTFVDREILILREMGVDVPIYSLHWRKVKLSAYQAELKKTITYLNPVKRWVLREANLRMFLLHPWIYLSTLVGLLALPHPNLRKRLFSLNNFLQGAYLAWVLRKNPPDHIHAHFLNESATEARIASRLLGIPYSVEVHASTELFVSPFQIPEKLAEAKFIATCTRYNKDYLGKMDRRLGPKTRVIYHGLDANKYRRTRNPQPGRPVILGVGQLKERKGYEVLVEACALLKQRGLDFECRIVGEGQKRPALEQQIARLGLKDLVILCGALDQEEVIQQYEQAAVFTLPVVMAKDGDRDGIPNVLLEAMAMETPVVSTRHQAITELIDDEVNGLLVPPGDAPALADALQRILAEPALAGSLRRAGRQTVLENFDPVKNARQLVEAFLE